MSPQHAQSLLKQQEVALRQWVCDHCGENTHLVPLALLYVNRRFSEQDWKLIRQYDENQLFEEFVRELVKELLETFSHGVWFGECTKIIYYWTRRYGINDENQQQDAEDYVKNKLIKNNFSRLKSYKQNRAVNFTTYISMVIRNLLIDYLRKKKPKFETLDNLEEETIHSSKDIMENTMELSRQQNLEEIGRWFFSDLAQAKNTEVLDQSSGIPDAVKLDHKERLFLRAVYKEGMSVAEAGRLPGINMSLWKAHSYHRKLKVRVRKILNEMGYENLQSLL